MAAPEEEAPASSCGAPPAEPARPQPTASGGDGDSQRPAMSSQQQPPADDGEGEGAAPPTIATAVDSPALRAAVPAAADHHHITHEDYDWMGVLDTLEAHHDGWGGPYHHYSSSPRSSPVGHGHHPLQEGHPPLQQSQHGHRGTAEAQAASLAASVAAHEPEIAIDGEEDGEKLAPSSPVQSENGTNGNTHADCNANFNCNSNSNENGNGGEDVDAKKQSRIEKKRNREKQRRLDTNAQFEALAEMVREIETVDFVEEARYNLSAGAGAAVGKADLNAGDHGPNGPGAPGASSLPQPTEGKSPESPSEPKKLKTGDDVLPPPPPPFNPSNRVDLIARTISQLSQFRALRRRRNEELTEARRRECELRKEGEELRRMVAHYKAVGMAPKPQEKVMMMVPMMVPQDAVSRIAAGYPAAHQYAAAPHPYAAAAASPWMASAAAVAPHQYHAPAVQPPAYALGAPGAHHPPPPSAAAPSMALAGGPPAPAGAAVPPRNVSAPPYLQPYSGHPSDPAHPQPATPGADAPPAGAPAASQHAQGQPLAHSYTASAPHHHHPPPGMHAPSLPAHPTHAAMAMYPQAPTVPGGMPSVAFGLHPHPPGASAVAQAPPPPGVHAAVAPPHGALGPAVSVPPQPPPPPLPSDKPPAAPPGGGGNLAHCA